MKEGELLTVRVPVKAPVMVELGGRLVFKNDWNCEADECSARAVQELLPGMRLEVVRVDEAGTVVVTNSLREWFWQVEDWMLEGVGL